MTLLLILLVLAVVGGAAAVVAGVVTGGMDDAATSVPARALPAGPPTPADVAALRFVPALRGYRMDQVDAAMDRLGAELGRLHEELRERDRLLSAPDGAPFAPPAERPTGPTGPPAAEPAGPGNAAGEPAAP